MTTTETIKKGHLTRPIRSKLALWKTWSILKSSDTERLFLGVQGELGVEDRPRDHERREQIGHDADIQSDGESLDGAGPVCVQEEARDDDCEMAVDDGRERPVEPGVDRRPDRPAVAQLLPDALEHK